MAERYNQNLEIYRSGRNEVLIPSIIQIEPVFGCNASCIMCVIDLPTTRKKMAMPMKLFKKVVDEIAPYRDTITQIDLFGLGEPLIDRHIFERIRYLKDNGLRGVGISTNADILDEEKQELLLESGVDTVIISIESTKKEVHEKIRVNTVFERVVENAGSLIKKRDSGNYETRFIFRFISQKMNRGSWNEYKKYWSARINRNKGDQINSYKVHNWVGEAPVKVGRRTDDVEQLECYQVFDRAFILADGTLSMCSCDLHHPFVAIGNVADANVIDVYNNQRMRDIREIHLSGRKNTINICRQCNMLYSRQHKKVF
ncbi:MAG: radical SAM/SPASM domain-containing protein [Candidatus Xenobiia bacterium LiM19]